MEKWIKWEDSKGKGPEEVGGCWDFRGSKGYFPHVHGNGGKGDEAGLRLGREEVDCVGRWSKGDEEGWIVKGWPFGDDAPSED